MLDLSRLNPLARDVAEHLFAVYPGWRDHARALPRGNSPVATDAKPFADNGGDFLLVSVEAPRGNAHALTIETDAYEVTLSFDYFHVHLDWPCEPPDELMMLVADILGERVAVIAHGDDGRHFGGATLIPADTVMPQVPRLQGSPYRVRVRSWRGTLDRDF